MKPASAADLRQLEDRIVSRVLAAFDTVLERAGTNVRVPDLEMLEILPEGATPGLCSTRASV